MHCEEKPCAPCSELLSKRDDQIWSVGPQDSVFDALRVLADRDVGALMVLDKGKLVGVFSERDYTRKIALAGRSSKDTVVADVSDWPGAHGHRPDPHPRLHGPHEPKEIRHLPVMDGDTPIGMISIRDIMDDIISDHELTISQLRKLHRVCERLRRPAHKFLCDASLELLGWRQVAPLAWRHIAQLHPPDADAAHRQQFQARQIAPGAPPGQGVTFDGKRRSVLRFGVLLLTLNLVCRPGFALVMQQARHVPSVSAGT